MTKKEKGKAQTKKGGDYRIFFTLGLCWIPVGASMNKLGILLVGLMFLAIGVANMEKWASKA